MKPLLRKDLWLVGDTFILITTMAAGFFCVSSMLRDTPAAPTSPIQDGIHGDTLAPPVVERTDERDATAPPSAPIQDFSYSYKDTQVRQVGEHTYALNVVEDPPDASRYGYASLGARVAPARVEGKPQGIKLFAILPGSIFDKLGFHNGDIIQRVNGHALDSPESYLETYAALKNVHHIEVDLLRGGVMLRKVYDVK